MGQLFRYAIATGRAERDPTFDLRDALPPAREKDHAALTEPTAVGALMREIEGFFPGETVTEKGALPIYRFAPN